MKSRHLAVLAAALFSGALATPAMAADASGGEQTLVITYHATPANRAALRHELATAGVSQFAKWQAMGVLKDYQVLLNRYVDSDNPDATALLTFANPEEERRWRQGGENAPSGLPPRALSLVSAIDTAATERVRSSQRTAATANSVYLVIPYKSLVSETEYLKYADGYTIPQFEGWMKEGVLARYDILKSKFPAGRAWNTMIVLEYKDDTALARREAVVTSVRAQLKANPEWKAISDNKKNVRDEKQVVVADAVMP